MPYPDGIIQGGVAAASCPLYQLRDAWVEFLSRYNFDWFCTLTFAEPVHPEHADKVWSLWVRELNVKLHGNHWRRTVHGGVYWVRASEYQTRGVLHFHALMGDVEDLNAKARRLSRMDRWKELAGFAKVEQIDNDAAVNRYVSKYVTKGGEVTVSRNLSSYAQQYAVARCRR